jgi:hypothetical protein
MSTKTGLSALMLVISLFLFWRGLDAVLYAVQLGSPLSDAIMQPPTSLLRLIATGALVLGAVSALFGWRAGKWLIGLGILVWCLLAGLMALSGADSNMWKDEAISAVILIVLFGAMIVTGKK